MRDGPVLASCWWGSLPAVASVPPPGRASRKCCSGTCHCPCFTSSCLHNCSPCSILSQDCDCVFAEAPCEPKSAAVTKSAAGPVPLMSLISVVSIRRDDVYSVFPVQTLVTARSRIWDSVLQRVVLHCKSHVCACILFLNYVISGLLMSPID